MATLATDTKASTKSTKSTTVKKGARITGVAREKLAADLRKKYEKGQSIRALAEGTGRSYGFVHRLLLDAEVPLRGRGGATRTKKK
nr:helix-turn-helix domain-containing protein [Nakamurella flava]